MGKIIVIGSGLLAALSWFAGQFLSSHHSSVADFVQLLCFPLFIVVFLLSLFLVHTRRSSVDRTTKTVFRWMRIAALAGIAVLLIAVFWPRSYGTPPLVERPDTRYWDLPTGSRIAYTLIPSSGVKKPYPIICLHGGPGGAFGNESIRTLAPLAADGYDIYLYDQIGGGESARLANIREYTADRHKRDLEAIVQKIGATKVILLGHSWGAILAVLYAADNPDRIDRIILTGPGPIYPIRSGLAGEPSPDSLHLHEPYYSNKQGNEQANNIRTRVTAFFATNFGIKLASDREADDFGGYLGALTERSTVADTAEIGKIRQAPGAGFYCGLMTMHSLLTIPDPRPKLRNAAIPLLVMKGQYDNQKWGYTHEYIGLFPNHRLFVIPNAGHSISRERPDQFLSLTRDFLKNAD